MLVTPGSERVNVTSNLPFEHVIRRMCDNTTAVNIINNMGTSH